MIWTEIRQVYPEQWLVVEALEAYTRPDNHREVVRLAVIEQCDDGGSAMQSYRRWHQQYPDREFYFVHTSREELDIEVRYWLGVRRSHEAQVG